MKDDLVIIFDLNSEQELQNANSYVSRLERTVQPNLLIWNGLEQLKTTIKSKFTSLFGQNIYGLTENKNGFFDLIKNLHPSNIHFLDTPESFVDGAVLSRIYDSKDYTVTEDFFRKEFNLSLKKVIPSKFIIRDRETLEKILPIAKDFDLLDKKHSEMETAKKKYNGRLGIIVTFYKSNYNNYESLKKTLKSLCFNDWHIVLSTHSTVPEDIQELCDAVIYESENVADQRKYSHGVAETSLIRKSLNYLRDVGIEWAFKVCYDVEVSDSNKFMDWIQDYRYDYVSCKWGDKIVSTNSFFCNVNFTLKNFSFFDSIDEMFKRSNFIEDIWEKDIIEKNLVDRIYTYETKVEMFGDNKIDTKFFNYDDIGFRYVDEEGRFYIDNRNQYPIIGKMEIVDYYSELSIYTSDVYIGNGSLWVLPNPAFKQNNIPKNGYYVEICDDEGKVLIKRNLDIVDFKFKHRFHRIHKLLRKGLSKYYNHPSYLELVLFYKLEIYKKFNLNSRNIKTFIDAGAHAGMFSLAMLDSGAKKGYLIEPEPNALNNLKQNLETDSLKVLGKGLYKETGKLTLNVFSETYLTCSIDPTWQSEIKEKIEIETLTIDDLFSNNITEESIDLFKIDIEGAEYDAFEGMSDETLNRCKSFLIEFHSNKNMKVLAIVDRLVKNGYNIMFEKNSTNDDDNYLMNDMGIIFASK